MFLPIDQIWLSWVAEYDFSIVTAELRSLSEGRLPDHDEEILGATLLTVKKPSMEEEGATRGHSLRDAHIETASPGSRPSMASNADLHRASEMMSSEAEASANSVWLKAPRRRCCRPRKTHPVRTMGAVAAIQIDSPAYLATLTCAISMEDRADPPTSA